MKHRGQALSGTMLILLGCTHHGSHLATEDMLFIYSVRATAQTMSIAATYSHFRAEAAPTFADGVAALDDDDSIAVEFRGNTIALVEMEQPDGSTSYNADLDVTAPIVAGESIMFDLERERYTSSTVTSDMAPSLVVYRLPASISRAEDIVLTWTPVTDDSVAWSILPSDCFPEQGDLAVTPGRGTTTIPGNTVEAADPSRTCNATLSLQRSRASYRHGAFPSGLTEMLVIADVDFTSTP